MTLTLNVGFLFLIFFFGVIVGVLTTVAVKEEIEKLLM